ncbi:LysM peptidoglycan-binding domain-containing protein [Chondrinema litorale]|uniref:LysM peptidoglycan-binding domain-containing protein n=1 Tax=Chondrinema litorale TaxID=2994555 RepID=UPI0025436BE0|nr:LysM peptidoglycan-binding domain-containing protein [Chondrinema litorale]UZR92266.1 LysM peptidoglycan-binding domain-containing protein [Chondrinema litorale]
MLLLIFLLFADPVFSNPKQADISESTLLQDSIHVVQKGETLYALSKKYNVTVKELQNWNELSGASINTGQSLIVYKKPEVTEEIKETNKVEFPQDSIHVVNSGEFASGIASKYNIGLSDLISWNKLKSPDNIYPGQKLKLYPPVQITNPEKTESESREIKPKVTLTTDTTTKTLNPNSGLVSTEQNTHDEAKNLTYDFTPGGIKTVLNVLVLVLLIVVFVYNIHK